MMMIAVLMDLGRWATGKVSVFMGLSLRPFIGVDDLKFWGLAQPILLVYLTWHTLQKQGEEATETWLNRYKGVIVGAKS